MASHGPSQVDQPQTEERDALQSTRQQRESLHQLLTALASCSDETAIVQALAGQLRRVIPIDVFGIARSHREQVRVWSRNQSREAETRIRRYLMRRLGHLPANGLKVSIPFRLGHARHLSLVPSSSDVLRELDERPTNIQEVSLVVGSDEKAIFLVQRANDEPSTEWEEHALHVIGTVLAISLRNAEACRLTQDAGLRDPLTELLNKQAFNGAVTRELRVGLRYSVPACLLMVGLDCFRTVNDCLGHDAGDYVLRTAAEVIRATVRESDIVGRCEGDTFAVVLPHTDRRQAHSLAERLRERIERHLFAHQSGQVRTTASIGLAALPDAGIASTSDWMTSAGTALEDAKAQGRNCVAVHVPHPPAMACAVALSLAA